MRARLDPRAPASGFHRGELAPFTELLAAFANQSAVNRAFPSLALDLLEEFRPAFVDRLSLSLVNLGHLNRGHFEDHPQRGVSLTQEGLKKYFEQYDRYLMKPWRVGGKSITSRDLFRQQAHRLARVIQGDEVFQGIAEIAGED